MKKMTVLLCSLLAGAAFAGEPTDGKTQEELLLANQRAEVEKRVDASGDTVIMAVDGLCCPTCGIGVKKNVQKLGFVQPKGVVIDPERALLVVKLKQSGVVDHDEMAKAIRKAGFEPVRFYQYANGGAQELTIKPSQQS